MLAALKRRLYEAIRCQRHNLLHLNMFRLSFDGTNWHVRDREGLDMAFPFYPYLAFLEIEGYMRQGQWRLERDMAVIDAGACSGEFSLYAARKVGAGGRVIMIEPDPVNLFQAKRLFELNGGLPEYVQIVTTGLWNKDGQLSFAGGLGGISQLVDVSEEAPAGAQMQSIAVETLSSLVKRCGLSRLDFVKMDIEGAELEVMAAARPVTDLFHPRFSIASYHVRNGKKASETLEPMFKSYGYEAVTGYQTHPTTWATPVA